MNNYTYTVRNGIYINLTNRCTNHCTFCIRNEGAGVYGSDSLWLDREPTAKEVLDDLGKYDFSKYNEVVFCGYGEPTIRIEELCEVARGIRAMCSLPIRINTNGQGNLINGRNIVDELAEGVDKVNVSLNAGSKEEYYDVCRPVFGEDAFAALIDFAKECRKKGLSTNFSIVDCIGEENIALCKKIAEETGVPLKIREFIK